jgi:hypothetical protein
MTVTPIFKLKSGEKWRPQPVETVERLATIRGKQVQLSGYRPQADGWTSRRPCATRATPRWSDRTPFVGPLSLRAGGRFRVGP